MNKEASNLFARLVSEIYKNVQLQRKVNQLEINRKEALEHIRTKTKVIPFTKEGEGGGLELTDYNIIDLLEILERGEDNV